MEHRRDESGRSLNVRSTGALVVLGVRVGLIRVVPGRWSGPWGAVTVCDYETPRAWEGAQIARAAKARGRQELGEGPFSPGTMVSCSVVAAGRGLGEPRI